MKIYRSAVIAAALLMIGGLAVTAQAQKKAPPYKIEKIKIVPFDEASGEFEPEFVNGTDRTFFNDLSTSLFVTVIVEGEAGSFEVGRKLQITVTEGKRVKYTKTEQVGLIGSGGRYHVPVWLYGSMCSDVKITAKLIGQAKIQTVTRTVRFLCGE